MAASFRLGEGDSPEGRAGLSISVRIVDAFDLAADDAHYSLTSRLVDDRPSRGETMQVVRPSSVKLSAALTGLLFAAVLAPNARSEEPKLSISGYDPVSYFTDGKPVQGKSDVEYLWHKLRWRFASPAHRDLFAKDPDHYAPQYDGYCALGASVDDSAHKDTVDPEAWAIVDGKLYLTHNRYLLEVWRENAKEHIRQADQDWEAVKDLPGPEIVGSPCAASPPTTKVALRDGGHWIVVGGQVARNEAGNVVGKGDLRAQIEQVGKNVGACLNAGGAAVKDIIFTHSYVTQPVEFDKYADLRQRYFGPPSPKSTMLQVPQLVSPDFLVQVEAFAKIR
jgi:enamine deaminase RidA (YjgF/YER057c/UK114 family)